MGMVCEWVREDEEFLLGALLDRLCMVKGVYRR